MRPRQGSTFQGFRVQGGFGAHACQGCAHARDLHFRVLGFRVVWRSCCQGGAHARDLHFRVFGFRVGLALARARDAPMPGIYTLGF